MRDLIIPYNFNYPTNKEKIKIEIMSRVWT